jgi:hypothetical protein
MLASMMVTMAVATRPAEARSSTAGNSTQHTLCSTLYLLTSQPASGMKARLSEYSQGDFSASICPSIGLR